MVPIETADPSRPYAEEAGSLCAIQVQSAVRICPGTGTYRARCACGRSPDNDQIPMLIDQFLISLQSTLQPRSVLLSRLSKVIADLIDADGALIALQHAHSRAWVGFCPDSDEAVTGRGLSLYAPTAVLDKVRAEPRPLFQPTDIHRLDASRSFSALRVKHAMGAPLRDLNRVAGHGDLAGVLMVYRRDGGAGNRADFAASDLKLLDSLAVEVSYAIKVIDERLAAASAAALGPRRNVLAKPLAEIKAAVADNQGDLAKAAVALELTRDQVKQILAKEGLLPWAKDFKRQYSPEGILELLAEVGDLRIVSRRLNRSYGTIQSFLRSRHVAGGLRGLVESKGLSWADVHGPEFEANNNKD